MAEETAVKQFLDIVNNSGNYPNRKPIPPTEVLKYLRARKFDVQRAVQLYEQNELLRMREGLDLSGTLTPELQAELETGKFTILPGKDASGAAIALFTANLHNPQKVTHRITLQGVVYQLDTALLDPQTQKAGLVFIYDMSCSKYSHFDYDLSQKILTLLKGGYPARLKKVLIVTAPLWFKAPFKILRLFVREKLRERVFTVSIPQLSLHIPRESLPDSLGGVHKIDHSTWLLHCYKSMTNREDEILANIGPSDQQQQTIDFARDSLLVPTQGGGAAEGTATNNQTLSTPTALTNGDGNIGDEAATVETPNANGIASSLEDPTNILTTNNLHHIPLTVTDNSSSDTLNNLPSSHNNEPNSNANANANESVSESQPIPNNSEGGVNELWTSENPPSSASSGFSDDDSLAGTEGGDYKTIEQIVEMVKERGRQGLIKEYAEIRSRAPDGTFLNARHRNNLSKNRYTDVLCYDHSRVILSTEGEDPNSDYINANFVDGYKQRNAYISTQGPLPKTSSDFWRMVWEQHCLVIVMTTRVMERGRVKCGQYWEPVEGGVSEHGCFQIKTISIDTKEDYTLATLEFKNTKTDETRNVSHWQFTSWPDYGVPASAMAMLNFLQRVREQQANMVKSLGDTWAGHPRGPPIVVHCSAGIGRTGTFITLDICISRLEDVGTADIRGTVEKIRSQRAYSIQMPDQYVFCHLALIEYAISRGMLQSADLTGFDDGDEDSD